MSKLTEDRVREIIREELRRSSSEKAFGESLRERGLKVAGDAVREHAVKLNATAKGEFSNGRLTGIKIPGVPHDERIEEAITRLDDDSLAIVVLALREALQLGHNKITPEHLLLAIIRDGRGDASAALVDMAGNGRKAKAAVIKRMAGGDR